MVAAHPKALVSLGEVERAVGREKGRIATREAEEWVTIVKQFSQRHFTYETDKMPAIMSIVSEWETRFRQEAYWAGLWSATLDKQLMWKVPTHYSPRSAHLSYIAPSWSWASRAHPIWYQQLGDMDFYRDALFEVVSCEVVPVHEHLPNGAIKSAQLTIKCIAELITLGDLKSQDASCTVSVSNGDAKFEFDDSPRPLDIRTVWLLQINEEEPYNNNHPIGIAVTEDGTNSDDTKLYKRVGSFVCNGCRNFEGPVRSFTLI